MVTSHVYESLLTHPGGAHKDEFLACCLLLAKHPVSLFRREPTKAELANPAIAVIDVGDEHAPERGNFDHHQFPAEAAPRCALSLVLENLGLYEDAKRFCAWLEAAEWFDCRGPKDTAAHLGVDREALDRLISPIDITLLRRFALVDQLDPGEPLWEIMRWIGEDLLTYVQTLHDRMVFLAEYCEIWSISRDGKELNALFLPRTDPLPPEPSHGIGLYVKHQLAGHDIRALVYPDRRGNGYALSRYDDAPELDFTRIEVEDDVHFAHARGFVAKTSASSEKRLRDLLQASWRMATD